MYGGSTIFSGGAFNAADPERAKSIEMTDANEEALMELIEKEPYDEYEANLQEIVKKQFEEHKEAGNTWLFDSPELHMLQTYNGGDYQGNPELITVLAENALPALEWIESLGGQVQDELGAATGSLWQRSHYGVEGVHTKGLLSVVPFVEYIEENDNIEIQYNTKAEELIMEDGRVVGVKAKNGKNPVTYTANKGVVIATGGFGSNVEMRQKYNEQWDNLDSSIGCSNQSVAAQIDRVLWRNCWGSVS